MYNIYAKFVLKGDLKIMKLKPLFDRVVLKPEEEKETKGGIILPTAPAE